jgi:hypothetical protein
MVEIRINNQSLDLTANVDIYFTFQINDFANLGTRQGSYTNNFTIPITSNNLALLGFPDNLNIQDRIGIDSKLDCEIYLKTLLVDKGFIRILRVNKISRTIQIEFFGSNSDWFEYFKGVKLNTIDLSDYAHQYNSTDIIASFSNTDGYIYPWINYGAFVSVDQSDVSDYETVMDVGFRYWLPAVFLKTLIERAFSDSPFKLDNQIENDILYQKAVIPFTNSIFGPFGDIANDLSVSYAISSVLNLTTTPQKVIFDTPIEADDLGYYDPLTGTYTIGQDGPYLFVCGSLANPIDNTVRFEFYYNGAPTGVIFAGDQIGPQVLVYQGEFQIGDTVEVYAYTSAGVSNVSILSLFDNPRALTVNPQGLYGLNSTVDLSVNLPDLSVADLLRWLIVSFGLVATYNIFTKTISIKPFSKIKDDKVNAKDWSEKLDLSQEVTYEKEELISNFGKSNIFAYKEDNNDEELEVLSDLNREPYGQGSLDIDNEFLEPIVDLFEAPFAATIEKDCFDGSVRLAKLPGYELQVLSITGISSSGSSGTTFTTSEAAQDTGLFPFQDSEAIKQYILIYGTSNYDGIYSYLKTGSTRGQKRFTIDIPFVADETGFLALISRVKIKSEPRILILDGTYSIDQFSNGGITSAMSINGDNTGSNNIPFAYFYKSQSNQELMALDKSLSYSTPATIRNPLLTALFDDYLLDYKQVLDNLEFIKCYIRLNDLDIQTLDQTIPVYIDYFKSYFYVNKIDGYNPNDSSTLVELIAI